MSINGARHIDIPVSSALGYKGALPLLEMYEDREPEHRPYNKDYVRIFLAVLRHEFSNLSLHPSYSGQGLP